MLNRTLSLGSMIAVTISWSVNHSVVWAVVHGLCSWFYVVYYLFLHK